MASAVTHDEVNLSQSVGEPSSTDVHASKSNNVFASDGSTDTQQLTGHNIDESHKNGIPNGTIFGSEDRFNSENHAQEGNTVSGTSILNGIGTEGSGAGTMADQDGGPDDRLTRSSQDLDRRNSGFGGEHNSQDSHLDANVGSDTDTSRADSTEQTRDISDRSSKLAAAKKPTSFKSVSVTKNFLAKTATVPAPIAKIGEKSPAVVAPSPLVKPRLVAKSGSGINNIPRPRPGADGATEGATVWNKNRPVPIPPPKQFTDEELKQQYGIHLASRIQSSDDTGKDSKWADIDEDEDDWTPETVVWMDGTKSTIVAEPTPPEPPKAVVMQEEPRPTQTRPILALKKPTPSGPPKTILRPGAAIQQQKSDELAARNSPQPRGSATSSPAPPPTKSPWAPLPPMEKSAPLFESPPPPPSSQQYQQHPAKLSSRDVHGFDTMPPPPSTAVAREMEADTFDRSYGDSDRGPRELFNSHSGRYEPAPEHRRPSMRHDRDSRHPPLLQRPSQHDTGYPAEPSAAFQTRPSQVEGSVGWGRRRGSSNSGTSGSAFERRQSISKPAEVFSPHNERIGSVSSHIMSAEAVVEEPAPQQTAEQEAEERALELARQKKIMQEKRELAIRRRKEEEEREEAERKERIRKRMEALGMAPLESKNAVAGDAPPAAQATAEPTVQQQVQTEKDCGTSPHNATGAASVTQARKLEVQPSQTSLSPEKLTPTQSQPMQDARSDPGPQPAAKPQTAVSPLPLQVEQSPSAKKQFSPHGGARNISGASGIPQSSFSSPGEQKAQPAFRSPALGADSFATWGHSGINSHPTSTSNVWGPPIAGRGIGNGAFDASYSRFANRPPQQQSSMLPTGAFSQQHPQLNRAPSQSFRQQDTSPMMHQQLLSDQNLASLGLADVPPTGRLTATSTGVSPISNQARPQQLSPIAPPQRPVGRGQPQQLGVARGLNQWLQFSQQDENDRVRDEQESTSRRTAETESAASSARPKWNTTFKQTATTGQWLGGDRQIISEQKYSIEPKWQSAQTTQAVQPVQTPSSLPTVISPAPPVSQTQHVMSHHAIGEPQKVVHESTVRLPSGPSSFTKPHHNVHTPPRSGPAHVVGSQQSRFFPSTVYGGSPPPEESDHPAFSSDSKLPKVNLPAPRPQVRLPPKALAGQDALAEPNPVIMPQRATSYRAGIQPLVQSSTWQARFNGLFGRVETTTATPPSPPKTPPRMLTPSATVASSTRFDLFDPTPGAGMTVSLPRSVLSETGESVVSKPMVDDMFDGELSFGSIPKVHVPRGVPVKEIFDGRSLLHMKPSQKFDLRIEPQSKQVEPIVFDEAKRGMLTVNLANSQRGATDIPYSFKSKGNTPVRKSSAKFNKDKRADIESKENTLSGTSSPAFKQTSRQSSFLKRQSPAASASPLSMPEVNAERHNDNALSSPKGPSAFKKPFKTRKSSGKVQKTT